MQIRQWETVSFKDPEVAKKLFESLGLDVEISAYSETGVSDMIIKSKRAKTEIRLASTFTVYKLKAPTVEKHVVSGTIRGVKFEEHFDDHSTAYQRKCDLEKGADDSDAITLDKKDVEIHN